MSLSSQRKPSSPDLPPWKYEAPPIIGPGDFMGMTNQIILIEHDDEDYSMDHLDSVIDGMMNIWFTPRSDAPTSKKPIDGATTLIVTSVSSIARVYHYMKTNTAFIDSYVIERIDEMNLDLPKKNRGALISGNLSMMASPKILRGGNLIVTSAQTEYAIRGIANKFLNLKK